MTQNRNKEGQPLKVTLVKPTREVLLVDQHQERVLIWGKEKPFAQPIKIQGKVKIENAENATIQTKIDVKPVLPLIFDTKGVPLTTLLFKEALPVVLNTIDTNFNKIAEGLATINESASEAKQLAKDIANRQEIMDKQMENGLGEIKTVKESVGILTGQIEENTKSTKQTIEKVDKLIAEDEKIKAGTKGFTEKAEEAAKLAKEAAEKTAESEKNASKSVADAGKSSEEAKEAAEKAFENAGFAHGFANGAKEEREKAETAQKAAEAAKKDAETARAGAETAKTGAETAKTDAETAQAGARAAQTAAEAAKVAAEAVVATPGAPGKSAFEVAQAAGFTGDETAWLASLKGVNGLGINGKSAYQIAIDNGFVGSEREWLESLKAKGKVPVWMVGALIIALAAATGAYFFPRPIEANETKISTPTTGAAAGIPSLESDIFHPPFRQILPNEGFDITGPVIIVGDVRPYDNDSATGQIQIINQGQEIKGTAVKGGDILYDYAKADQQAIIDYKVAEMKRVGGDGPANPPKKVLILDAELNVIATK